MRKHINKKGKDKMVSAYLSGYSQRESAELIGAQQPFCCTELKRRNIPARPQSYGTRKHNINESFFDNINTEEKAYFVGFITSDGNIFKYSLQFGISKKDIDILKKLNLVIDSDYPVRIHNYYGKIYAYLTVTSKYMIRSLAKIGILENKSFSIKPCDVIPKDLLRHYWRGVFDGDGSIYKINKPRKNWYISLSGNRYMITGFSNFINSLIHKFDKVRIYPHENIFEFKCGGRKLSKSIAEILYKDSNIFLDRKKKLANKLLRSG